MANSSLVFGGILVLVCSRLFLLQKEQGKRTSNRKREALGIDKNGESQWKLKGFGWSNLTKQEMERYGRQMVLSDFGSKGQVALKSASVLVVGAGGLGCPVISMLAGAGVGRIGIVDGDVVEISNLHRQTLHREKFAGKFKVESAKDAVRNLNSSITCEVYNFHINYQNVENLVQKYDVIVEATDSLESKYLLNDACILAGKPLVFGAAQGLEGQFGISNRDSGCYRCVFPTPPPLEHRSNCSDDGVVGPIPQIIGAYQALQVIHLIINPTNPELGKYVFMFSGGLNPGLMKFSTKQKENCKCCGPNRTIFNINDAQEFCDKHSLSTSCQIPRVSVPTRTWLEIEKNANNDSNERFVVVDVRKKVQYNIWSLDDSINIPLDELEQEFESSTSRLKAELARRSHDDDTILLVVCRRGNDSQIATKILNDDPQFIHRTFHVSGGLEKLSQLHPSYPKY